jgi:hypothetical protein
MEEIYRADDRLKDRFKVLFFAGGETHDNRFNPFTGSFIRLMKEIMNDDFDFIRGVYFRTPMRNVIWALNHAQKPVTNPENEKKIKAGCKQIINACGFPDTQLVIISSSSGSVVAAQTACCLAKMNSKQDILAKPFHLVLGASMVSIHSELYNQLIKYQEEGTIGIIIHDEVQDEGDNSHGVGGTTIFEAYRNAFGLMVPFLSRRHKGPSFLNTHPETGHIHRRRSQTIQKAFDYINIILIKNKLAGDQYCDSAKKIIENQS